jgi:hypothetical protein
VSSFTDKNGDENTPVGKSAPAGELHDPNRRHFSRQALAGSAVLLSLGNRSAWGQTVDCMSVTTINSFDPTTGLFASAPAGKLNHNADLAAEIHRISDAPDYLGTDGTLSTCKDPDDVDGICLVSGDCPP